MSSNIISGKGAYTPMRVKTITRRFAFLSSIIPPPLNGNVKMPPSFKALRLGCGRKSRATFEELRNASALRPQVAYYGAGARQR